MQTNKFECPDYNTLIDYFSEDLSRDQLKEISEHLCTCNKCIEFVRTQNYNFIKTSLLKAHPLLGKKLRTLYKSSFFNFEAASSQSKKVQQLISSDKKFELILRPSKDQSATAILEIHSFDHFNGAVNIFLENELLELIEFEDGYSFLFVDSSVDLTKIKLYYKR